MVKEVMAIPLRALSRISSLQSRPMLCVPAGGRQSLAPAFCVSARSSLQTSSVFGSTRRTFAASSQQQQPNALSKASKMVATEREVLAAREALTKVQNTRFPPGYWEMTWPEIQIEAVRYGLAGAALIGTAKAVNFSYELSTFLVTGSEVPAAVAYFGGFGTAAAIGAGAIVAHRAVSINAEELRRTAFGAVQKEFLLERLLGGGLRIGDAMASRVEAAGVCLKEKRRLTDYFAPFAWKSAEGQLLFQVVGEQRTALVSIEVEKEGGRYRVLGLRVEVQDSSLPHEERVFQLVGEQSGSASALEFLGSTCSTPVRKPPQYFVQLGNLW